MKNRIIIFLIPGKIYQFGVLSITKSVANRFNRILYISLNKTADKIIGLLKETNIDTKKFLFIEAITRKIKPVSNRKIIYINSPKKLEKFTTEFNQILEKEKFDCIIFDSLSTMLIYQDEFSVIKFTHDLVTKLTVSHASGQLIYLSKDINSALVKDIAMFADNVISMREEQEKGFLEKKENTKKLEKELAALKSGYKSKFISAASYKKNKERIDKRLQKLRGKI